ncbi:alpha/beta fold hydrolase [Paraburkholderia caballeronis]|uniref:alpha/beta fold hydrolase n=1 Tax=Paraburkholderia caballeronis TaxID=416943 RepID=UPI00106507A9|nr:alpha/beta hydrolase [Paraburkholderia caballeronis]TDV02004.1 pimeloyl-ACP methyl ester carboxylesterase [Paraburkholderia caballeronis]TDV06723.1 pimeloyl-ACP methyl ester carboxylesterase [Paraburkholderia caballeronis]TDV16146.1 pimeloyl-ACP methyl ester carboxylesterase [Paraburkholderia caballeronis]
MSKASPLVMIHGLMGSLNFFAPHERIRTAAVHTPDLIGYGLLRDARQPITLASQAAHVIAYLRETVDEPCVLLGHSVGGAVAMLAAVSAPERVRSVINVEGNFTLGDAFWCRKIAGLGDDEWHKEHERLAGDPHGWLVNSGIEVTPQRLEWARLALANQPRETIQAMARAVVAETGDQRYLERIRGVVDRGAALFLLAGEKSVEGWNVPGWATDAAQAFVIQQGVGHLMMLEQPDEFCRIVGDIVARLPLR